MVEEKYDISVSIEQQYAGITREQFAQKLIAFYRTGDHKGMHRLFSSYEQEQFSQAKHIPPLEIIQHIRRRIDIACYVADQVVDHNLTLSDTPAVMKETPAHLWPIGSVRKLYHNSPGSPYQQPVRLPELNLVLDNEVYSYDFVADESGHLRRSFVVLGRYTQPTPVKVAEYLQEKARHLDLTSSITDENRLDGRIISALQNLEPKTRENLADGDAQLLKVICSKVPPSKLAAGKQFLEVDYFSVDAPLYRQECKTIVGAEWYHYALSHARLMREGLQKGFALMVAKNSLHKKKELRDLIQQSSILETDKEGAIFVLEAIADRFSPESQFMRLSDISEVKIQELTLEPLMELQKEGAVREALQETLLKMGKAKIEFD